jgi:hypothetical protein
MKMKELILPLNTHVSTGAASALATYPVLGELYAILYVPGTIATGATLTVTCEGFQAASKPLLTKANAGTANLLFYPRDLVHAVADGAALTGTAGGDRTEPILAGIVKATIASGGNSEAGYVVIYYED